MKIIHMTDDFHDFVCDGHPGNAQGFEWLDIRDETLLAAQSLCEPLILLSSDEKLARYGATIRIV